VSHRVILYQQVSCSSQTLNTSLNYILDALTLIQVHASRQQERVSTASAGEHSQLYGVYELARDLRSRRRHRHKGRTVISRCFRALASSPHTPKLTGHNRRSRVQGLTLTKLPAEFTRRNVLYRMLYGDIGLLLTLCAIGLTNTCTATTTS